MKYFFNLSQLPALAVPDDRFDVRFIHTENITVAFNELKTGAKVPLHTHLNETIDFIQEGTLQMTIGEETMELNAGAVARVPSHVPHSAIAITNCKVINVFYPLREDFQAAAN